MHQQQENSQAITVSGRRRIAYLDCFAGISGDMFLAALIDAGVDPAILHLATSALNLGATLQIETVDRSGISSTKVHVLENGKLAESPGTSTHTESHSHSEAGSHSHSHSHSEAHSHSHESIQHQEQPERQQRHNDGHSHGRSLTVIRELIQSSELAAQVKQFAIRTFELLGASEARIHNVDIEAIHFHEVGAVDAIVDIVAASAGIHALNTQALADTGQSLQWVSSPLNVGGGMVDCAHGRFPVPAPATADLLRGMPTYSAHIQKELVTPTGAALLRALNPTFGPQPAMRVAQIGYGAGTRNPKDFPNVLRLSIGDSGAPRPDLGTWVPTATPDANEMVTVTVLETALDDLSPQILATIIARALALGAHDAMLTSVLMKKGRPGTLITILCDDEHRSRLEHLLFTETTTLGIRVRRDQRICLDRNHTSVTTPYGSVRIKLGARNGEVLNAAPEFEDCRAAANAHNVPVKQVIQAATAAYLNGAANVS
ncbi:nickel pincer cofactor biosynthesis protein LarC [soil metagenome]